MPIRKYVPNFSYNAITKSIDKYVAVSNNGAITTSSDGRSWNYVISGTTTGLTSILYSSATYIIVGVSGLIRTSTDLMTWSSKFSGTSNQLNQVVLGGGNTSTQPLASTSLLMRMNGANASTTFTDSSSNNFTITTVGNTINSTADFKYGTASAYFDGVGDYLTAPDSSAWDFTGQFCVECWFKCTGNSGAAQSLISNYRWSIGTNTGWGLEVTPGTGKAYFRANDGSLWNGIAFQLTGTTTIQLNTWYHIAVTRDSSNMTRLFLNGVQEASGTMSLNPINTQNDPLRIGCNFGDGEGKSPVFGYIDDIRVIKNEAIYTSNFTPPLSELTTYTTTTSVNANFITVGNTGTALISADTNTWYSCATGTANALNGVTYANSLYVAVGASGTIITSPDTTIWTVRSSGTALSLNKVVYGNGRFVAVGASGACCYSIDGITWTFRLLGSSGISNYTMNDICYNNYSFIACTSGGNILVSPDGIVWELYHTPTITALNSIISTGNTTIAVGSNSTIVITYT
jgi:hypothetical protein